MMLIKLCRSDFLKLLKLCGMLALKACIVCLQAGVSFSYEEYVDRIYLTYDSGGTVVEPHVRDKKIESLMKTGTLNPRATDVKDMEFVSSNFFDSRDLIQVKYEMLRRVEKQGQTIVQASTAFGFSRTTFYQVREAMLKGGLANLIPRQPGPKSGHKVTEEVVAFVEQLLSENKELSLSDLVDYVKERFGIKVHPRSIERRLSCRQKKQQKGEKSDA